MDIDPNLVLLAIALANVATAILTLLTRRDVRTIEKATNSMKDALVKATGEAAHAAGRHEARMEGEAKAAIIAQATDDEQKRAHIEDWRQPR